VTRGPRLSLWFLAALLSAAYAAPVWSWAFGLDPYAIDFAAVYRSPSAAHWLGTDDLGRDVLARLFYGARISLTVGLIAAFATTALGGTIGLVSGWLGGAADALLMRIAEAAMSLPRLPFLILLLAIDPRKLGLDALHGPGAAMARIALVVVLLGWTNAARLARASALQARERGYVEAARALGFPAPRILFGHVLPNAAGPLGVAAALEVGQVIVYESVLSFLGLGIQPPEPSWGAMLRDGMTHLHHAPILTIIPGLMTLATVASINVLAGALDPRTRV
jgi:peptide/nickel transport system permease protein